MTETKDNLERTYFRARREVRRGLRIASAHQGIPIEILLDHIVCAALPSLGGPTIAPRPFVKSA